MKNRFMNLQLCISISERPGHFGETVHNAAFRAMDLDFLYKACKVTDITGAITGIKALGIRGCSVSMPFKEKIISFLDDLDLLAKEIGAVNTIVNENGHLIGYNTDVDGARETLKSFKLNPNYSVLLLGAGGAARAILVALKQLSLTKCTIANRTIEKAKSIAERYNSKVIPWEERENFEADILINATPIGMKPNDNEMPILEKSLKKFKIIMDFVSNPPKTKLIKLADSQGLHTIDGLSIALYQAASQFQLYTGVKPPIEVMRKASVELNLED